jgi:hypothetical protein
MTKDEVKKELDRICKDEVKKEFDRIFGEYIDFEDISNALLELPADIVDEIFSE